MTVVPDDWFLAPKVEGPDQCRACRGRGARSSGLASGHMTTCSRCGGTGRHVGPKDILNLVYAIKGGKRPYRVEGSTHGPVTIWDAQDTGWVARVKESLPLKNEIAQLIVALLNSASWLAYRAWTLEDLTRLYVEREELRKAGKLDEAVAKQQEIDRILRVESDIQSVESEQ